MARNDVSCEPMDIDLSNQSVKDMDISYDDSDIDPETYSRLSSVNSVSTTMEQQSSRYSTASIPIVKKYHINIQKPSRSSKNRLYMLLVAVIIVFISIITYHVYGLNCCDQLNLKLLNETIAPKLFGQSKAIELLIQTLDVKARSKLLFFSGGTGVGKTFTSSMLLDSVDCCSNVYHYTMPSFTNTFSTDLMFGLVICRMSLIIVDDLSINDIEIRTHIQEVIKKSEDLGKDITVILIYNCNEEQNGFENGCDSSFKNKLLNNFSEIKALKRFIKFEPLSEKHLRECIKQELGNRKLSAPEFEDLLKNFNVSVDGCKGVHSKMKYLNIV